MALIADLLLIAAALGAAFYCFILSRRLSALNSVEGGIGKAIGSLSEQVARLEQALDGSRKRAEEVEQKLRATVERADLLEATLARSFSAPPVAVARTATKAPAQRADAQPASFRRRLFSDATGENGS